MQFANRLLPISKTVRFQTVSYLSPSPPYLRISAQIQGFLSLPLSNHRLSLFTGFSFHDMDLQQRLANLQLNDTMPKRYTAEFEINDFSQTVRCKMTSIETLSAISHWTGASITTRGWVYPPDHVMGSGERKLYLYIEGPTEVSVQRAHSELKLVLEKILKQTTSLGGYWIV